MVASTGELAPSGSTGSPLKNESRVMELSKDTWHYRNFEVWKSRSRSRRHRDLRIGDRAYDYTEQTWNVKPPRQPDLCTYTRIVVLYAPFHRLGRFHDKHEWFQNLCTFIFLYLIALIMGFAILTVDEVNLPVWSAFVFPFIFYPAVGGIVLSVVWCKQKLDDWAERTPVDKPQKKKQPNVVLEYVKAKKRKICPIIEFEDV